MSNTTVNAHNVQIEIDDELGAQIDVSGNANNFKLDEELRVGVHQAFKDAWDHRKDGGRGWKAEMTIFYSIGASEAFRDIWTSWRSTRGARTLTVSIPDATSGSDEWSGEVVIDGTISIAGDRKADDVMTVAIPMGGDGTLTRTTIV